MRFQNLAKANDWLTQLDPAVPMAAIAEDLATDSFQNLLFSILLFLRKTTRLPEHITIVSHEFKRKRFLDLHCRTLNWPAGGITYVGIDPKKDEEGRKAIDVGEDKARADWELDWWGYGENLDGKRRNRGWRGLEGLMGLEWEASAKQLMLWEGGETRREVFPLGVPGQALS